MSLRALLLCTAPLLAGLASTAPAQRVLDGYDLRDKPAALRSLPSNLREISGLAVSPQGRLFAHDDESAEVSEIDPATGKRLRRFGPGRLTINGDYEGLAIADGRLFIISSEGTILEFSLAEDGARSEYVRHQTGLARVCDVEGLAHDERSSALLVLCKTMYAGGPPGIYAFDLETRQLQPNPRFAVRLASGESLNPSGLAVHARTGHLLLVAASQRMVVELDRTGNVVASQQLDRRRHPQAEGIEFLPDGSLVISDEAPRGRAQLTIYAPVRQSGS
jgi:uncharacterized protein YjiK